MSDYNLEMENRIKKDKGLELEMYEDSKGNWAIGWGHGLTYPISMQAAQVILDDNIETARNDVAENFLWAITYLPLQKYLVLVELCFWIGIEGLLSFKNMIAALKKKDYKTAAFELMDSEMGREYPERSQSLANILKLT